jgi:hypothetical protein
LVTIGITVRSLQRFIACCPHEAPSSFSMSVPVLGSFPVPCYSQPILGRRYVWILAIPKIATTRVMGKPLLFQRSVDRSDADLVLLMDVVVHVEDDVGLVREYVDKVAPSMRSIVTVPAFMWLLSDHDVSFEHFRRYTLPGIERVLRAGGLTVEVGCYFYAAVLPLAALSRVAERLEWQGHNAARSQMRGFDPLLNAMFWLACRAELPLFRANRLTGLTVFIRAVK